MGLGRPVGKRLDDGLKPGVTDLVRAEIDELHRNTDQGARCTNETCADPYRVKHVLCVTNLQSPQGPKNTRESYRAFSAYLHRHIRRTGLASRSNVQYGGGRLRVSAQTHRILGEHQRLQRRQSGQVGSQRRCANITNRVFGQI